MPSSLPVLFCLCTLCSGHKPDSSRLLRKLDLVDPSSFLVDLTTKTLPQNEDFFVPFNSKSTRQLSEDDHGDDHGDEHGDDHGDDHGDIHGDDHTSGSKPYGKVIGGTLLVNLATILGVFFLIPFCRKDDAVAGNRTKTVLDFVVPSFASGALIATALFLTIPESIVLVHKAIMGEDEHGDEHRRAESDNHDDHGFELPPATVWRVAVAILVGFLFPKILHILIPHKEHIIDESENRMMPLEDKKKNEIKEEFDDEEATEEGTDDSESMSGINKSLVIAILVGDSLCNFCDGVFVGIAISLCNSSIAWAVIGITFYHEVAQELADYFLLTRCAGLKPFQALLINFVTGLTVVFGGILTLVMDLSDMSVGILLGLASGVYLYISTCECLPRVDKLIASYTDGLIMIAMFALGAIPMGLTLLGHVHCDAH